MPQNITQTQFQTKFKIDRTAPATALVVGASQGIGLGFVKLLLEDTAIAKIYATYRKPETAQALMALSQWGGDRLVLLKMDVTDEAQIESGIQHIQAAGDKLHVAIYCVGMLHDHQFQPEKSLRSLNKDQLLRYFEVNAIGAGLLAKHLMAVFRHEEPSIFATISAKVGSIGDNQLGGWYGYRASKAALNMLMKTAALEYARRCPNTQVILLHPGTTDTRLSQPFQRNVPPEKLFTIDRTVQQLWKVLSQIEPGETGQFLSWDGSELPW
ncbi:MAG: SDR family NAD(P)-dependent oxidoreductase [Synechococcales cyanobacterium CRU_2_2]|nr:SDR family NAD(P)-dependent oxidoreductase [Synechococcales cyanobacterium CRU_2_2]